MNTKRKSFEEKSVLAWIYEGETYAAAKARLDALWKRENIQCS